MYDQGPSGFGVWRGPRLPVRTRPSSLCVLTRWKGEEQPGVSFTRALTLFVGALPS